MELSSGEASDTGVSKQVSFAFRSNRDIRNFYSISFYSLIASAEKIYNFGEIYAKHYSFFSSHLYNKGLINSKAIPLGIDRSNKIDKSKFSMPQHKSNTVENEGTIFSDAVSTHGYLDVTSNGHIWCNNLSIDNGDISNSGVFDISENLDGNISNLNTTANSYMHIGHANFPPLNSLNNNGRLHIDQTSTIDAREVNNNGEILGNESSVYLQHRLQEHPASEQY